MDLRCRARQTATVLLFAGVLAAAGCSDAVKLTGETGDGGVVTYLFKENRGGPVMSPHRKDAIDLIERKCPSGYAIVREGEAQSASTGTGLQEGTEDEARHRRWALQFRCKPR